MISILKLDCRQIGDWDSVYIRVDVRRDDLESMRFNLKAGEKQVARAENSLELVFEHAASATLQLNGVDIPFPAAAEDGKILLAVPGDDAVTE